MHGQYNVMFVLDLKGQCVLETYFVTDPRTSRSELDMRLKSNYRSSKLDRTNNKLRAKFLQTNCSGVKNFCKVNVYLYSVNWSSYLKTSKIER
jgi:hypothetical protein